MTHNQLQLQSNRIEQAKANEVARHNQRGEELTDWLNRETQRHNVAVETEANRHQVEMEQLESTKNSILNYQATETARHNRNIEDIQMRNVNVEYYKAQENARHNREQEEINRWLAANETTRNMETSLHNRNTEALTSRQISIDAAYKSAAAANQRSQSSYNKARTKTENATRTPKTVNAWEDVILNPFNAISQQFKDYASGLGSVINALR